MDRNRVVSQPAGSKVTLRCRADGKPKPRVHWFKDGRLMSEADNGDDDAADGGGEGGGSSGGREFGYVLKFTATWATESGEYTCRVYNQAGSINFTYTVDIIGESTRSRIFIWILLNIYLSNINIYHN